MSNILLLPGAPTPEQEPVKGTIELLEKLLESARRGEVRSIAVAWTENCSTASTDWFNNHEHYKLQGAVAQLLHDLCDV